MRPLLGGLALMQILTLGCGGSGSGSKGGGQARPTGPMTHEEAQQFVLSLVNRDRADHDLPPVTWDETAAKAGQGHADDMAANGFTAHIGSDGSVPELRHTEAGGAGMVMENVGCFADGEQRTLDPDARFLAEGLEKIEHAFMAEVPPADGHKRNILTPWHTSFGVGISLAKGLAIPCMSQEFTDDYGAYADLPKKASVGTKLKVKGELKSPATIAGVGVARVDRLRPMKPAELNRTGGYAIPKPYATYFPKGFKTPIPVQVDGNAFHIELPLTDHGRPGLYEISIWAKLPQTKDLLMVSLRTIRVE